MSKYIIINELNDYYPFYVTANAYTSDFKKATKFNKYEEAYETLAFNSIHGHFRSSIKAKLKIYNIRKYKLNKINGLVSAHFI